MLNHKRPSRRATRRRHAAPPSGARRPPEAPRPPRTGDGVPGGADFPVLAAASRYALDPDAAVTAVDWDHQEVQPPAPTPLPKEPAPFLLEEVDAEEEVNPDLRPRRTFVPAEGLNPLVGWGAFATLLVACVVAALVVLTANPGAGYGSDPAAQNPVPAPAATVRPTTAVTTPPAAARREAPRAPATTVPAATGEIDDSILDGVPTTQP